jgi:hypothetical protein
LPNSDGWLSDWLSLLSALNWDLQMMRGSCEGSAVQRLSFLQLFWGTMIYFMITVVAFLVAGWIRHRVLLWKVKQARSVRQQAAAGHPGESDECKEVDDLPSAIRRVNEATKRRVIHSLIIAGSLFYLKVTTLQLKALHCITVAAAVEDIDQQQQATVLQLLADVNQVCFTGAHAATVLFVCLTLLAFTAGFPFMCLVILCRTFGSTNDTTGVIGFLIRRFAFLRVKPKLTRQKAIAERAPPDLRGDASVKVTVAVPSIGPSFAELAMDQFGVLFQGLCLDHFAFRLSFFAVNIATALIGESVALTEARLRLFLLSMVFAVKVLFICYYLPFNSFTDNARQAVVYMSELVYTVF